MDTLDRNDTMHPAGAGERLRRGFVAEIRHREEAQARWAPIWAESGIASGLHAMADVPGSGPDPAHASAVIHGVEAGRLKVGDLVALHAEGAPDDENQHLRRVAEVAPSADGRKADSVVMGPAIPRRDWPAAMLRETTPVGLEARLDGATVRVTRAGTPFAEFAASEDNAGIWLGYVDSLIRKAARSGKRDGLGGGDPTFAIRPASGASGRTWEIVDSDGRLYANDSRSLLQRRAPERVEALLRVAKAAHAHAHLEARVEGSLRSTPTLADMPVADDEAQPTYPCP